MINKLLGIAIIALVAASCESSGNNRVSEPIPAPTTFTPDATPAATPTTQGAAATTTTPVTNSNATVALNPAHGAPGHRCELPVGAPLDGSAGAATAAPAGVGAAPMMQIPPAPLPSSGQTARLNPAHGAPGHDCSIPVGQPLRN
ncbi:hypothetical protein [Paracnuella aquatica]|uniref:hypothetical protein n=1 Tax=Paracnuella aquatica TaxID=2268757 RepID=UPI000DEFD62E|nr:hypothetical protein [Paracnuella aquatica]RPD49189.1 hypothetical protein DRJ53_08730 [Paracnuella aquatica]